MKRQQRRLHQCSSIELLESRGYLSAVTLSIDPAQSKLSVADSEFGSEGGFYNKPYLGEYESAYSGTIDADLTAGNLIISKSSLVATTAVNWLSELGSAFIIEHSGLKLSVTGNQAVTGQNFSTGGMNAAFTSGQTKFVWESYPANSTLTNLSGKTTTLEDQSGTIVTSGSQVTLTLPVKMSLEVQFNTPAMPGTPSFVGINTMALSGTIVATGTIAVGPGSVSGQVFNDLNENGKQDNGETGVLSRFIYADQNGDDVYDNGEAKAITDENGNYTLASLPAGSYIIRHVPPGTWKQTSPANNNGHAVSVEGGAEITGINFGTAIISGGGGSGGSGGSGAEVAVSGNGVEIASGDTSPSSSDYTHFGTVAPGGVLTRTFKVSNSGDTPLQTSNLKITKMDGASTVAFVVTEPLATTIAAGASDTFTVRFSQEPLSTYNRLISFDTSDSNEGHYKFQVRAEVKLSVASPEVLVSGKGVEIASGDRSPSTTDNTSFGSTSSGGVITRTFTVKNTGSAALKLSNLKITRPDGSATTAFSIIEGLSSTLAAGASDTFTIRFSQKVISTYDRLISFNTNDGNENPYTFQVRATVA